MGDYRASMKEAVKRTRSWDLDCRGATMMQSYLSHDLEVICKPSAAALADYSRQIPIPPSERAGACAGLHVTAATLFLEDGLPLQPVLTIGDVLVDGRSRYGVSRQSLRRLVRKGKRDTGIINIHAWLTWPDFTIFDLTLLPATLHEAGEEPCLDHPNGLAVVGRPDKLAPHLSYIPMLVGEAFLWRIGAISPIGEQLFERAQLAWINGLGALAKGG